MNPLKRGFLDVVKTVRANKWLFVLLIVIQFLFILFILMIGVKYQIKIYENVNIVMGPLDSVNYNATSLEAGQPFMPDMMKNMATIMKGYEEMINNIYELLFLILGLFLVVNGFMWVMIKYISKGENNFNKLKFTKKVKNIFNYWKNFVVISLVFLIPVGVISYFVLINLIAEPTLFKSSLTSIQIIFLISFYFMIIGFCLLHLPLKTLFKKVFVVGIMQAHWILLSLLSILVGLLLSLLLIYFGSNSLGLMILGGFLTVTILVFGKFFLVSVVRRL